MFQSGIGIATTEAPRRAGDAAADEGLRYQQCEWCHTTMFRRLYCPVCASSDLESKRSEGTGIVRRSRVLHRNTSASRNVAVIEMAEGFSLHGRVIGSPLAVRAGSRVRLSSAIDPVRQEFVFELTDPVHSSWF